MCLCFGVVWEKGNGLSEGHIWRYDWCSLQINILLTKKRKLWKKKHNVLIYTSHSHHPKLLLCFSLYWILIMVYIQVSPLSLSHNLTEL